MTGTLGPVVGPILERKIAGLPPQRAGAFDALEGGRRTGVRVIAEIKPAAPDRGVLRELGGEELEGLVRAMEAGGASAISVLVEPRGFNGSLSLLQQVAHLTELPLLAKGFLFTPDQLAACLHAGASAYLHMVRVVSAAGTDNAMLLDTAHRLGLEALVEANTADEVKLGRALGARIVGVNNRDIYGSMGTDLTRVRLGNTLPPSTVLVSLSGIEGPADLERIYRLSEPGVDAVLVGSSIMRAEEPERFIGELVREGKKVAEREGMGADPDGRMMDTEEGEMMA